MTFCMAPTHPADFTACPHWQLPPLLRELFLLFYLKLERGKKRIYIVEKKKGSPLLYEKQVGADWSCDVCCSQQKWGAGLGEGGGKATVETDMQGNEFH